MSQGWVTYEREKLYHEVWGEPIRDVAQRYEVSDVALGKVCRKLGIPLPGRGYWAKVRAGKAPRKSALPALPQGTSPVLHAYRTHTARSPRVVSEETSATVKREMQHGTKIVVPAALEDPDESVVAAGKLLTERKPRGGLVSCRTRRCLDIEVAPSSLDRALRIMDALLKGLDGRGLKVEVTPPRKVEAGKAGAEQAGSQPSRTRVLVEGEWIPVGLREELDTIRYPDPEPPAHLEEWRRYYWIRDHRKEPEYVPSGRLALRIKTGNLGVRRTWRDAQIQRVEKCLNDFIAHLYLTAEAIKQERIAAERRRLEAIEEAKRRAEAAERREEEERVARIEERRREVLDQQLERWQRAQEVEAFLARALRVFQAGAFSRDEDVMIKRWLDWVRGYSNGLDPLSSLLEEAAEWEAAVEEPRWRWQPWRA